MTYRNGYIPDTALGVIPGTGKRILRELIQQTVALRAAFKERFGKELAITDAYRDYQTQVVTKSAKGSYAATPGTSNHGLGKAIDFGSRVNVEGSPEFAWMKANASKYGWFHPLWAEDNNPKNGQQEPWHWEAVLVPEHNYTTQAIQQPDTSTEDDMPLNQTDLDHIYRIVNDLVVNRMNVLAENESKTRRPLFIRRKDGLIVSDIGTGYRPLDLATWIVWENLGYSVDPKFAAMDPDPFMVLVNSLGGLKA